MATQRPFVRIHAIVARKADVAVVFRRGPSKRVQVLKWNLKSDEIEPGQWFKGEIVGELSDLSPDGEKMAYLANRRTGSPSSWIAVSHPPYLTALALWPSDWIHGGGEFLNNRDLVLRHAKCKLHPKFAEMMKHPGAVRIVSPPAEVSFYLRLRGWQMDQTKPSGDDCEDKPKDWNWFARKLLGTLGTGPRWHKRQPGGFDALVGSETGRGVRYRVVTDLGKMRRDMGQVDWADWDHRGQLIYAAKGCLWRVADVADVADAKSEPKLVADLNANKFTEVVAPDWAKQW